MGEGGGGGGSWQGPIKRVGCEGLIAFGAGMRGEQRFMLSGMGYDRKKLCARKVDALKEGGGAISDEEKKIRLRGGKGVQKLVVQGTRDWRFGLFRGMR